MDDERQKKLEAGREKLAAYKKKKQTKRLQLSESTSTSQSDSSLSLTPPLLPESRTKDVIIESDNSIISEHLNSNSDSIENDRSFQEIEVSNLPSNFSSILQNLASDEDLEHISQEIKPTSLNSSVNSSSNSTNLVDTLGKMNADAQRNVQSILDEILKSERFQSDSERTIHRSDADSVENSFNIFKDINLNDSLIIDYDLKCNPTEDVLDRTVNTSGNVSLNSANLNISLQNVDKSDLKVKQLEELLTTKDTTIAALAAELESLREITSSNQSTLSLNTSTTDYKLYQDEFQSKIVEFQNALSHRDSVIQQLTEALQQSVINREQLQDQSEYFSREIVALQRQLAETSAFIGKRKWDKSDAEVKHDSLKCIRDNSIQTDSLPSQILPSEAQNLDNLKKLRKVEESNSVKVPKKGALEITEKSNLIAENDECKEKTDVVSLHAHKSNGDKTVLDLEIYCSKLEETLNVSQVDIMTKLKNCINSYIQSKTSEHRNVYQNELKILEDKLETEKIEHEAETTRLRELIGSIKCDSTNIVVLRQELQTKHAKELEELRTYFEKKCAELEKHYSEEVFSQHSRKMSGSSSTSEASDFLFSGAPHPGPGGDSAQVYIDVSKINPKKCDLSGITKDDLIKLKNDFSNIAKDLSKYNLETISKQELATLRTELNKYDLRSLLKYDLSDLKAEMQNKYHAELEILREDYENRIDTLNVEHEHRMQSMEQKYVDKIESLKFDLDEALRTVDMNVSTAVQEVMLVANTVEDAEWPTELLQIRNRFTEKYEKEISELKEQHQEQIKKLKDEHLRKLNGSLERARRKSSKDDALSQTEIDIIKDRDNLKKTTSILRQLIAELTKYFGECEDELNNTLVDELLKQGFDKNLTELEVEINLNESSNSTTSESLLNSNRKRVHFTPRFEELLATIDSSAPTSLDSNVSVDLKNELGACLKRLRVDANAILELSASINKNENQKLEAENENHEKPEDATPDSLQARITSLTKRLISEGQIKKDLSGELEEARNYVRSLEIERANLDTQVEQLVDKQKILETDLGKARQKIAELIENGHKEIVSEGYGENPKSGSLSLGDRIATLSELQERARSMVAECASNADHPLLQLVEELCREGDRVTEEAKNDHEDLQQQVEHLEQQMRDMSKLIEQNELKQNEVETEKREAIEKIFVLRDIIRDLETQIEVKSETETELRAIVSHLEDIVKQQNKVNEELTQLSSIKSSSEAQQLQEHILHLQDEIQRLRLNTEFAGSEGALKQIKTQLNEFEANIDKWTRDLEALHSAISTTSCSSPSEDMSIRDQIRPKTPTPLEECDLPLQQLARLKEKLVKHSRVEDAAVKRIRDLEMQLDGIRHDLDEVQNERDLLQDQVSEQLVLISSLQMRLDDQRLRAEQMQKQTNTSLEVRIYDLENEVKNLMEAISTRDKTIKQLMKTIEETKKKIEDQELELSAKQEDKVITDLQKEIQKLHAENSSLLAKINSDAQNAQVLPNLVDNIIADKNKDIEKLQEKLDQTQSELNAYLSLNLDREQLKTLSHLQSSERAFSDILSLIDLDAPERMRKAEKTSESLQASMNIPSYKRSENETTFVGSGHRFEPDISSIENIGQPNIHFSVEAPLAKPNSTEIQKSAEKHVHFEDSVYNATIEKLHAEILELKNELFSKEETLKEYAERLRILCDLEVNIAKLQDKLDFTENALEKTTETFEKEQLALKEIEKNLRVELAEKKMHLMDKEKQLELSEQDSIRKDQMYINIAKEKRELEKLLNQLQEDNERLKEFDDIINENNKEIAKLKTQLVELGNSVERINNLELQLKNKNSELNVLQEAFVKLQEEAETKSSSLNGYKEKLLAYDNKIKEKDELNLKLEKDLKNMESQCSLLTQEIAVLKQAIEDKNKEIKEVQQCLQEEGMKSEYEAHIKELKNLLIDRETEIEILNEDANRYQDDILQLESKLKTFKNNLESKHEMKLAEHVKEIAAKDLQIIKLNSDLEDSNRDVNHLRELINEKDKIVKQMSDDSKTLRVNLEAIQNKMQESGNVVDLKRRLEEEQQLNLTLQEELNTIRTAVGNENKPVDMSASIEDITGAVRQQLDYSAHLDSNILSALSTGDHPNLGSLDSNDIVVLRQNLSREKALKEQLSKTKDALQLKLQELEQKYENEKEKVGSLQALLENEKQNCEAIQLEDANMLEQLRIRLEGAIENETEFEKLLEMEKRTRRELEQQIASLKQKIANLSSGDNSKTELTEYKSLPNNLESLDIVRLRRDVQVLQDENAKLKIEIKNLKKIKSESEATLKYSKDMLELKNKEIEKLGTRIEGMRENEAAVKEKLITCKYELEQRSQEVENSRALMAEMEQEGKDMKKEVNRLNEGLQKALDREAKLMQNLNEGQMKQSVPDKFLNKMKELSNLVKEHIKDNKQMSDTIDKLTNERMLLQERINELEEQTNIRLPFDDPIARANHLFARYLRSESYRKALIWQKKYLVALLATYQTYPLFYKELPLSAEYVPPIINHQVKSNGLKRLKAIGISIIAVIRMQFLVQRWHSGKRRLLYHHHRHPTNVIHKESSTRTSNPLFPHSTTQFQVGQPVSSQNFATQHAPTTSHGNLPQVHSLDTRNKQSSNLIPSTSRHSESAFKNSENRRPTTPTSPMDLGPWSGATPPSKEREMRSRNPRGVRHHSSTASSTEGYAPLQAPALLSQYVERFDNIQQRLGLALEKNST